MPLNQIDTEGQRMRVNGMANANARLNDPTLSTEERAKWERIQRIVQGESLAEIYPEVTQHEKSFRLVEED